MRPTGHRTLTRFGQLASLIVVLFFAMLSEAPPRAQTAMEPAAGTLVAMFDPGAQPAGPEAGPSEPEPAEASADPVCDCQAHTLLAGAPDPHAQAIAAGLIGPATVRPDHASRRSLGVAPPIRPPRPQAL